MGDQFEVNAISVCEDTRGKREMNTRRTQGDLEERNSSKYKSAVVISL